MKVINSMLVGLLVLLASPLALTACPTCYYFSENYDSVGEMETSSDDLTNLNHNDYYDQESEKKYDSYYENHTDNNGFTDYDYQMMQESSHDEAIDF